MHVQPHRLIATWIIGAFVGTLLIAVTSPLLVRSYAPLHADPVRSVWTLPPHHTYRWRSEGYANTQIGPLGMPGKITIGKRREHVTRVALWGDSQAEGVCVADHQKIFAQAEQISGGSLEVFPLARSGEDMADWLTQLPAVEKELAIDVHVFLIVDLPDLQTAHQAPLPPPSEAGISQANQAIAARLPALVIQAARNLLMESDETTHRSLRFSFGPVPEAAKPGVSPHDLPPVSWPTCLAPLGRITDRPSFLLYAPKSPQIVDGKAILADPSADEFAELLVAIQAIGVSVIDARDEFRQSARAGNWAHGFHHGRIGSGHLNSCGNRIVAQLLVRQLCAIEREH